MISPRFVSAALAFALLGSGCGDSDVKQFCESEKAVAFRYVLALTKIGCASHARGVNSCGKLAFDCEAEADQESLESLQASCEGAPRGFFGASCEQVSLDDLSDCRSAWTDLISGFASSNVCYEAERTPPVLPAECRALTSSCPGLLQKFTSDLERVRNL